MKKLRKTELKKLQIHYTGPGNVYSIVIPVTHIREMEEWVGEFQQGARMSVTLLDTEPGVIIRPERDE